MTSYGEAKDIRRGKQARDIRIALTWCCELYRSTKPEHSMYQIYNLPVLLHSFYFIIAYVD